MKIFCNEFHCYNPAAFISSRFLWHGESLVSLNVLFVVCQGQVINMAAVGCIIHNYNDDAGHGMCY